MMTESAMVYGRHSKARRYQGILFRHSSLLPLLSLLFFSLLFLWSQPLLADSALLFPLAPDSPNELIPNPQNNWEIGAFFGVVGILVLINIGQAWIAKEGNYIWYGVYLLTFSLSIASWLGHTQALLHQLPLLKELLRPIALCTAIICYCQFSRSYFQSRRHFPAWNSYLQCLSGLALLIILLSPVIEKGFVLWLLAALGTVSVISFFTLGIFALIDGMERAQAYMITRLLTTPFVLALIFGMFELLPWSSHTFDLLMIALCLEGMVTTYSLIQSNIHSLKTRLQHHHTKSLELSTRRTYSTTLRNISHEIRTPISGVIGMSELLLDTSLTRNQREQVLTIRRSGEALLKWLNQIGDWSALQSGKLTFHSLPFELPELIQEVIDDFSEQAEDRHVLLRLDMDPRLPSLVKSDPARLKQILSGFLEHALYYSEQGELTLHVKPAGSKNQWLFELSDSHSGLQPEEIKSLSEENPQNHSTTNPPFSSPQRDWHIALQLAQQMGGSLSVNKEQSEQETANYRCQLTIPRHTLLQRSEADYDQLLRGKRLLIVDDSASSRKVVSKRADRWGMRVSSAPSGKDAIAMLRTVNGLGGHFDFIILDHNMPGMSGMELAEKINTDPSLHNSAIIVMLSGASTAPNDETALRAGIRRVLSKPITAKTLKITLAEELTLAQVRKPEPAFE